MTDEIDPELLFDLQDSTELEELPEGSTITIHGPDGETLAKIDTADADAFAYFREDTIVDGAGQTEKAREFHVRDTER